jgi:hypothetical protein
VASTTEQKGPQGPKVMPLTNNEKQADYRARQAMLGLTEVRGIYAHPADHKAIKEYAAKLTHSRLAEAHPSAQSQ